MKSASLHKIKMLDELQKLIHLWRFHSDTIVFTNGCFDLLHRGHITYLEEASMLGNRLIVAVNSDLSVKSLKGENRPVQNQNDRALILAALQCVDAVIIFNELTPMQLIEKITPDVLVKGGDYLPENVVGKEWVEKNDGKVMIIPFVDEYSSSSIIKKI
jgi:D-beta-D-heptose 7-phosphate kinase/D-beta-D-heptose 1-phosphate adenosyltransferase